jgi:hypothetical protein
MCQQQTYIRACEICGFNGREHGDKGLRDWTPKSAGRSEKPAAGRVPRPRTPANAKLGNANLG